MIFGEELIKLPPLLFFEFQKEYYRLSKKRDIITEDEYSKLCKKNTWTKKCYHDFIELMTEEVAR